MTLYSWCDSHDARRERLIRNPPGFPMDILRGLLLLAESGCLFVALVAALGVNICQIALTRARRRR